MSEIVLYTSDDGRTRLDLRVEGQTVWLTQLEIAELFQTTKQNVSLHAKNIFEDGELSPEATVKESLTVQAEGKRKVQRTIQHYNLDLMLASNDQPLLNGPGSVSHEAMKTIAVERYDSFDANRRMREAIQADAEDIKAIEDLEKDMKRKGGNA